MVYSTVLRRSCLFVLSIGLCIGGKGRAEDETSSAARSETADTSQIQKFTTEELHALVAPIALYPDVLLAQILPASAFPVQIVEAYRHTQSSATPEIPPPNTSWDGSVIALLHYPTILKKLNDDPTWTDQLGVAATFQMDDVSRAIQQVRAEAEAVGNLRSNNRQLVENTGGDIQIQPVDQQTIYVPEYNSAEIYDQPLTEPIVYGGYPYGAWLGNSWDWRRHRIWVNSFWDHDRWREGRGGYWNAPYRTVPAWYSRYGGQRYGAVAPRNGYSGGLASRYDRVHPVATHQQTRVQPRNEIRPVQPRTVTPYVARRNTAVSRYALSAEEIGNRGHQTFHESNRGQISRQSATRPQPVTRPEPAPVHHVEHAAPAPVHPYHEEIRNPSSGAAAHQESNRGAASRGHR